MKRILLFICATLLLLAVLTACSQKGTDAAPEDTGDTAAEEQTISGIVNRLDDYLVLLDDDGNYHVFDFGEDVDQSSLEEGDSVTVTYTGTLDNEDPSPVATVIQKAE